MTVNKTSHIVVRNIRGMDIQRTSAIAELSGHGLPSFDGIEDLPRGKIISMQQS